ncbi:hypothetical protein KKB11_00110 [Candidatus Micrarchaeota archaeon]|nr:hypothetical protein [Candidatus Micrarchaeota archaeon]
MTSITLSVPQEIRKKMKKYDEVNWSAFVRKCITKKTDELEGMEKLMKEEKEINAWAVSLQKESRKGRFKELKKKGLI